MRKLDSLGYIQGHCGFLTDTERINIVIHHLEPADFIAEIKCIKDAASAEKKYEHVTKIIDLAPKSEKILTKAGYTIGADIGEFTSSQYFTKGCIDYIF